MATTSSKTSSPHFPTYPKIDLRPFQFFASNDCNLEGCLAKYCDGPVPTFMDAESIAPWIKVVFGTYTNNRSAPSSNPSKFSFTPDITVGYSPSPKWGNLAYIKSMEYQIKDGNTLKLEVVDQQGGVFHTYADSVVKCPGQMRAAKADVNHPVDPKFNKYSLQLQWGWSLQKCSGSAPQIVASPIITFMSIGVQAEFRNGLVVFTIDAIDMMQVAFKMRSNGVYGTDRNPMPAGVALATMMWDGPPRMDVELIKAEAAAANKPANQSQGADPPTFQFYTTQPSPNPNDKKKPKVRNPHAASVWQTETQSKIAAAAKWLEPLRAKAGGSGGQGVIMRWDNTNTKPSVMIMSDPTSVCNYTPNPRWNLFLGTYIVGGGPKSNVLGFNTRINWTGGYGMLMQGGVTGNNEATMQPISSLVDSSGPCNGLLAQSVGRMVAVNSKSKICEDIYGKDPKTRTTEVMNSMVLNKRANAIFANLSPIDAELRIQGNPDIRFVDLRLMGTAFLSIIALNPFYLWGEQPETTHWQIGVMEEKDGKMSLIEDSICNNVLSNKHWRVVGCTHSIKEGTYTTTLHVQLISQLFGQDPDIDVGVGGDYDTGWKPAEFGSQNYETVCQYKDMYYTPPQEPAPKGGSPTS